MKKSFGRRNWPLHAQLDRVNTRKSRRLPPFAAADLDAKRPVFGSKHFFNRLLDADETMRQPYIGEGLESASNRFVVLSRSLRESCYWNFDGFIYASSGPFRDLYLDIAALDQPIPRGNFRFTRNLLIGHVRLSWTVTETAQGHTIQAGTGDEWWLDYDAAVEPESVRKRPLEVRRRDVEKEFKDRHFLFRGGNDKKP